MARSNSLPYTLSDAELAAVRVGDTEVWEKVWLRWLPAIRRKAARAEAQPCDVEDMVMECFQVLTKRLPKLRHSKAAPRYVTLVCNHCCRNHRERLQLQRSKEVSLDDVENSLNEPGLVFPDPALRALIRFSLHDAFGKLTRLERKVLTMRFDHELSARQVASELGTTENNVNQIVHRAKKRLTRLL